MPKMKPPVEHRFSSTNQPAYTKNRTPRGPYFKPLFEKVLKRTFRYNDPDTKRKIKLMGGEAVVIKTFWEALQGNMEAVKIILNRVDGKQDSTNEGNKMQVFIGDKFAKFIKGIESNKVRSDAEPD